MGSKIEIRVKKMFKQGPCVEIMSITAPSYNEVTEEYIYSAPSAYKDSWGSLVVADREYAIYGNNGGTFLHKTTVNVGDVLPLAEFDRILEVCKQAAKRLREMERELHREYGDFIKGKEETYTF